MHEDLERDYQSKVGSLKNKVNLLHFSTGADSIVCYLRLKEAGISPILIYHYYLSHLKMVDNYIDYFSKKFDEKIYQFPSSLFCDDIVDLPFQKPVKKIERWFYWIQEYGFDDFTKDIFDNFIKKTIGGDVVLHLGIRYTDGIRRYQHLIKNGVQFNDKFYPVAPFKVGDIYDYLDKYECYLPIEYGLWGISFESPRSWNVNLIKEHCPETYRQIENVFPLVGSLGLRKFSTLNQHFKSRLTQFKRFAMPKYMYPEW